MKIEYVSKIPKELEINTLYICPKFSIAIHICPCGCGGESVTPLGNGGWTLTGKGRFVSLCPSILNKWCKTHYWIKNGQIEEV